MNSNANSLSYSATGFFTKLVADYVAEDEKLQPFSAYHFSVDGIKAAMKERQLFKTDRVLLTKVLRGKYEGTALTNKQQQHLEKLTNINTFTITTAHQPNIFTGPLYFIYKILHAIKLADYLTHEIPVAHFVPVYYMGSEDADLNELGHIFINGEKFEWKTKQTGAVGRMKVDKELIQLIHLFSGQLLVEPHGAAINSLMSDCYKEGVSIAEATFKLVNTLFAEYGLLILQPDDATIKNAFTHVILKEIKEQFSHVAVAQTVAAFPKEYKIQTAGREVNLFYLLNNSRQRIERVGDHFYVVDTELTFTASEMEEEVKRYPERFSPNVILRPVLQDFILPNVAFIGGGGEIAYWLELKKVFEKAGVPYPVLVVRNSFLIIENKQQLLLDKLSITPQAIFKPTFDIVNDFVKTHSHLQVQLTQEKKLLAALYNKMGEAAGIIDSSLAKHTSALFTKAFQKIETLEKKMLRAEKLKFEAEQRQITKLKSALFPNDSLQERTENFMLFYAKWGNRFLQTLYEESYCLEQEFKVVSIP